MIYSLVGTHAGIREKARQEFALLGAPAAYIYSEQAGELEKYIDMVSLFGEVSVVCCVSLSDTASSKEILQELLPRMQESATIFIIDEPFGDTHTYNRLAKVSKKIIDAKEEKQKATKVFDLCDAFAVRDKKRAWELFQTLKETEQGEAIAGALWWKFQGIWSKVLEGKKTAFSQEECEVFGKLLMEATILAHTGERDLFVELERTILRL